MLRLVHSSKKFRRFPQLLSQQLDQPISRRNSTLHPQLSSPSSHDCHIAGPSPVALDDYGRRRNAIRSFLISMQHATTDNIALHSTTKLQHPNKFTDSRRNRRLVASTPTISSSTTSVLSSWVEELDDSHEHENDDDDGFVDFRPADQMGFHPFTNSASSVVGETQFPEEGDDRADISELNKNSSLPSESGTVLKPNIPQGESKENEIESRDVANEDVQDDSKELQDSLVESRLSRAVSDGDINLALELFNAAMRANVTVSLKVATELFFRVCAIDPIDAYEIFKFCTHHPDAKGINHGMYRKMCKTVGLIDPTKHYHEKIIRFIESFLKQLDSLEDTTLKVKCYPKLVLALLSQKSVSVGKYANLIYKYMVDNEFPLTPSWMLNSLSYSKYNRQEDLPFHDVLARLAVVKRAPYPPIALRVVQNMFPYDDSRAAKAALQSILEFDELQQHDERLLHPYRVSTETLEAMSASAARSGDFELIMTVWDAIDAFNCKATEAIYENTIVAFASNSKTCVNAFAAMDSMLADGFQPSRALIRSVSYVLRANRPQLFFARYVLSNPEKFGVNASVESLNVVLSAFAERGDVNHALSTLSSFETFGLKPNADSYSFAMEVLGKDVNRRKREYIHRKSNSFVGRAQLDTNIDAADEILTRMEGEGIDPNSDIIRNYVELLCLADEVTTATAVVNDLLQSKQKSVVNNKAIYRVAIANANLGNFEIARKLASVMTEPAPNLLRAIGSREQRRNHLEHLRRRDQSEEVE